MLEKAPLLEVQIIEGNAMGYQNSIKINALGYNKSKREESDDHYVYFGSCVQMNGKAINDVVC